VANVRSYFNKYGGSLGTTGSLDFLFERKCIFKIAKKEGINYEELELELIDYGVDELGVDEEEVILYGGFEFFGKIQKYLEENGFEVINANFERIPTDTKALSDEQEAEVMKLIEKFEEDDDVQNVFHNMR
jgi:transcriptional/translational regulatory protein YebC/TACO1